MKTKHERFPPKLVKYRDYKNYDTKVFEVGFSPSKKNYFTFFNENPLKMMKNAFYFILEALFVHRIFKFLS